MECLFDKLGDELIIHILSFLPTKYAVLTSVLSRRWQYLWCYANKSLHFDCRQLFSEYDSVYKQTGDDHILSFYNFIDRVLNLNSVPRFDKFFLVIAHSIPPSKSSQLVSWIEEIVQTRKAKEVEIYYHPRYRPCVCLPIGVFQSTSLRVLKLHIITPGTLRGFSTENSDTATFFLPNLRILHFWLGGLYHRWWLLIYLFRASPCLEEAIVGGELGNDKKTFYNIYAPSLKRLRMKFRSTDSLDKFFIKAPVLEELIVVNNLFHHYVVKSNCLVDAKLDFGRWEIPFQNELPMYVNRVCKLLCTISDAKSLNLKAHTVDALSKSCNLSNAKLPQFHGLCRLKLCFVNYSSWDVLSTLLECSPNLQVLVLSKYFRVKFSKFKKDSTWIQPSKVPVCLVSRLSRVEVWDCESDRVEFDVISYLLKHGEVLNDFLVELLPANLREENIRFKDELMMVPRASSTCQLEIFAYPYCSPHSSSFPDEERNCRVTKQQLNVPPLKMCYEDIRLWTDYFNVENLITRTKDFKVYRGKICLNGPYDSRYKDVVVKKWVIPAESPYNEHKQNSTCHFHEELKLLQHPNFKSRPYFMNLLGYCEEDSSERLGVVCDFKPLDNLENLIPKDGFSWLQRIKVALVLACSLEYMHRDHGDLPSVSPRISPACVILDENYIPGLFDFQRFHKCKEVKDDDDEKDVQISWKDYDESTVYNYGVTLLGLISKRAHQCPLTSKSDDTCPISKLRTSQCVTLDEWIHVQEYERDLTSFLCKSKLPLVHKELTEDSTYDFSDGLKLSSLAMRCIGGDRDMPSIHSIINTLCKLHVVRKNWDALNCNNVISKYLNV